MNRLLALADQTKYTDWKKSQKLISEADRLSERSQNPSIRPLFYKKAGVIFYDRDIFDVSLKYNIAAYDYYKTHDKDTASETENILAIIYARLNQHQLALKHFRNVYDYNYKVKRHDISSKALNNIATIYLGEKKLDSALIYYQKAISQLKGIDNIDLLVTINSNIARVYSKSNNGNAQKQFEYVEELLKHTDAPNIRTLVYNEISEYYIDKKNAEQAIKYAELAKKYSKVRLSFSNRDVLSNLYRAYLLGDDYKKSAEYFQIYDNIRDSLNIEEKAVNVEREKIESDYRNKEQSLTLENNKKRLSLLTTILILLVVTSILVFFIIRYKNNLLREKLQNELATSRENELKLDLELKNRELFSKSLLETERSELYHSLVKELKSLSENDNMEDIKKEVNGIVFRLSRNSSTNWDEFSLRFNHVYDSFYDKLQELHPDLNQNDKKLCALIKLNLSSKDIADITKTSIKSVENSRTRLRKKLGITNTKTELHNYLSGI